MHGLLWTLIENINADMNGNKHELIPMLVDVSDNNLRGGYNKLSYGFTKYRLEWIQCGYKQIYFVLVYIKLNSNGYNDLER